MDEVRAFRRKLSVMRTINFSQSVDKLYALLQLQQTQYVDLRVQQQREHLADLNGNKIGLILIRTRQQDSADDSNTAERNRGKLMQD